MIDDTMHIAIVGHVDHGKSTLTGRLFYDTGCLTQEKRDEIKNICDELGKEFEFAYAVDHLQEEREQEMTIDTAQTFFKSDKRRYVIIDTPGHKEFLRAMITGTSQAEAAVLIVDAGQGLEEQSKRHAYVLSMLHVNQVVVVINKMDMVDYSGDVFNKVKAETIEFLKSLGIVPQYFIPISAKEGDFVAKNSDKMPWYNGMTVLEALDSFKSEAEVERNGVRIPVQDIYDIKGEKIIVGKLGYGKLKKGDELVVLPGEGKAKIKAIKYFKDTVLEKDDAIEGESIGFTVENGTEIKRGYVLCTKDNKPTVSESFKADLFWMSEKPIKVNDTVTLKIATEECDAVIEKINKKINSSSLEEIKENLDELGETEVGDVIIKAFKKVITDSFNNVPELGRFVLVRDNDIAGGGIVA